MLLRFLGQRKNLVVQLSGLFVQVRIHRDVKSKEYAVQYDEHHDIESMDAQIEGMGMTAQTRLLHFNQCLNLLKRQEGLLRCAEE